MYPESVRNHYSKVAFIERTLGSFFSFQGKRLIAKSVKNYRLHILANHTFNSERAYQIFLLWTQPDYLINIRVLHIKSFIEALCFIKLAFPFSLDETKEFQDYRLYNAVSGIVSEYIGNAFSYLFHMNLDELLNQSSF